jgi:hypothetical protein
LITGEGSPYYLFHPLAAERAAATVPDVKVIAMLRNPVSRAYSHYQHEVDGGFEELSSFEAAIDAEPERLRGEAERLVAEPGATSYAHRHYSYLARGRYAEQLEVWFRHFPESRCTSCGARISSAIQRAAHGEVLEFLGLPPHSLRGYKPYNAQQGSEGHEPGDAGAPRVT